VRRPVEVKLAAVRASDWWRSFSQSFHLALLGPTGAHWLDGLPDVSCKDSTRQHAVDDPLLSCNQLRR
jgi:hypothetical protein